MKTTLLSFFVAFCALSSNAQTVPNGSFETWETMTPIPGVPLTYEEPTGWTSFNFFGFLGAESSAQKVTDAYDGNYALKLINVEVPFTKDTIPGLITTSFPAVGNPTQLTGYYKSNTPAGESGQIVVYGHETVADTNKPLGYTAFAPQASTYTPFFVYLSKQTNAIDSFSIVITSFSGGNEDKVTIGAYVQIDNLSFSTITTSSVADQLKEGIQISPNPSNGQFHITNTFGALQQIEVANALGETVFSAKANNDRQMVDLSSQPKGMYIIYTSANDKLYSKKVLIQ